VNVDGKLGMTPNMTCLHSVYGLSLNSLNLSVVHFVMLARAASTSTVELARHPGTCDLTKARRRRTLDHYKRYTHTNVNPPFVQAKPAAPGYHGVGLANRSNDCHGNGWLLSMLSDDDNILGRNPLNPEYRSSSDESFLRKYRSVLSLSLSNRHR
jgi:hypothetical protein